MKFRPCIDIHNGKVKQIVGGSLRDEGDCAQENFASEYDASIYARMYLRDGLRGGHVIMLNHAGSPWYEATKQQALSALEAAPGMLQIGGGINPENAGFFLAHGASHVIVTSYVFRDGKADFDALERMRGAAGKERLVLDISCRKRDGIYFIVTDRWQHFTDVAICEKTIKMLSGYCDEFLVHGVDVEGRRSGPSLDLVEQLAGYAASEGLRITYAGGISDYRDIESIKEKGRGMIDFTIGSALDLFGGTIAYKKIIR